MKITTFVLFEEVVLKMDRNMHGVLLSQQKIIDTVGGNVLHGMKNSDCGYDGFGESYFSTINAGSIKGWKRHRQMTLNLIVPIGEIRFVIYDDRQGSETFGQFEDIILSRKNYFRLTIAPMLWLGFQGTGKSGGMLLNIASIPHDPYEVDRKEIDEIAFEW